ncbi:hypothetical protein MKZ38_002623 [Zalerion maritima]|uniref:Uncharacterized protein n=1 Tax=Zalerion maritima TaxID=339359 RepID=A0AAD5WXR9_9PEZI|nr:hypothetical protein MKZ38_002623 [Zalerion maritima]
MKWCFIDEKKVALAPLSNPTPEGAGPSAQKLGRLLLSKTTVCLPPTREALRDPERHFLDEKDIPFREAIRCGRVHMKRRKGLDARRPRPPARMGLRSLGRGGSNDWEAEEVYGGLFESSSVAEGKLEDSQGAK